MEVYKTFLFFSGFDEEHSYLIDTIYFEGAWWLVASWFQARESGERIPNRLVRLDGLKYQEVNDECYRFLLNSSIPKSVMDGKPEEGYLIKQYPAVQEAEGPKSIN